jgi:hypothetical protein
MQLVAALPQGALVLPGFDFDMPDHVWSGMGDALTAEDHPQFRYRRLMDLLGKTPADVQRWTDATSIADYDSHDEDESTLHARDEHALNWAQWRVATFKDPRPRGEAVLVDVVAYANSGGNVANLLNAEIGQRLQLTNMPADTSATSTVDLFIEGIEYQLTKSSFRIKFTTSPLGLENTVARLGVSSLNTSAILGY